jgi:phosphohistidine phosphatase SixA
LPFLPLSHPYAAEKGNRMFRLTAATLLCLFSILPAGATEAGWALMRDGGQAVLIRHAMAPGTSDSNAFSIADCATQRNLSDRGKQQAERIGALIAARAEKTERVLSSRFCRCLQTATIAFENTIIEPFDALDLLAADPATAETANAAVRKVIASYSGAGNLILVTHLENIKALTGISPREGEAVIVRAEGESLRVLGRIVF